jgi:hypothetical protein
MRNLEPPQPETILSGYCTVSVVVVECCVDPDVPVIVIE